MAQDRWGIETSKRYALSLAAEIERGAKVYINDGFSTDGLDANQTLVLTVALRAFGAVGDQSCDPASTA